MQTPASPAGQAFVDYAGELLASVGRCRARRMFGGWGLSVDGLTFALVADLGDGLRLWLKADEEHRAAFEAAGCARFTYDMGGVPRSMGYYTAPDDAMESAEAMQPWARLAWAAALSARAAAGSRPTGAKSAATPRKTPPAKAAARKTTAPKKKG